ncbi:MAG: 23S rRNA (guanosine(2251)-2'-O)-methyltransferase RlmB [Oscillospiraceae bacterium]|nr:23S rRNA (guanosine(2251)-2'-O)-methyltransferase RlmB [Oscillospiraceae bacterium]
MDNRQVEGRRAVAEALRAGRPPDRLYVLRGAEGLGSLLQTARELGAVIVECERSRLDAMAASRSHQGVIGIFAPVAYSEIEDLFSLAANRGEAPLFIVCDGVEDEGNLGAVIRSAEAAGAHGVVIPKRRSAGLSPVTLKASAGAAEHIPVARVPGIPACLRALKERGVWVYGADAGGGSRLFETDFSGACAIVVGAEGRGLSKLTAECCDFLVSIPMRGKVGSLNVSAAAAVMVYQALRSREGGDTLARG